MALDLDEFSKLFEPDPVNKVREVFGVPDPEIKPRVLKWKGQQVTVYDFELFQMTIKDWMKRDNLTKDQAIDEFFGMF